MMRIVAMQFDEIDASRHTGWSVLVQGTARWLYEEQDPVEVDTWAPGPRPYVVRVTPVHVSGRRIQLHQMATDDRGDMYRCPAPQGHPRAGHGPPNAAPTALTPIVQTNRTPTRGPRHRPQRC